MLSLKHTGVLLMLALVLFSSCQGLPEPDIDGFETFTLRKGKHHSVKKRIPFNGKGIKVIVEFNESAIYNLAVKSDQADINKLIGFSDCNTHHHNQSARIGWRWYKDELEILAYVYNEEKLMFKSMGHIPLNTEIDLMIQSVNGAYEFSGTGLDSVAIDKVTNCGGIDNYWLWPYFGGNQSAPHDITIRMKREKLN